MSAISDNLIHFLARNDKDSPNRQFSIFKLIIESGLRTSRVQIKFAEGASILNQIICFTDIPLRECNEHTSIYGKFGIGFKKAYVKNAGGNPARYFLDYMPGQTGTENIVESRGGLYFSLCEQYKFMNVLNEHIKTNPDLVLFDHEGNIVITNEQLKTQIENWIFNFSFEKEMGDLGPARDETNEIDLYYKEREWRLVPSQMTILSNAAMLSSDNNSFYYKFNRKDVNMVVVPNEEMRSTVLDYFLSLRSSDDSRLQDFGANVLPIINYDDLQKW
ncbi:abortive infection system antitoxin AbiGi family protein [Nitrosomonas sp.]|uniref:abortive infection system antitoxin AbiGi family protein n=1 Tax=Nitrosomonas sp. TaxID=42353 RepID=UPI002609A378|nr:abortive infection system antitoxin AbiGi family protein [Nitrosomonas sp.]